MKILWICNKSTSLVDTLLGKKDLFYGGGWIEGALNSIVSDESVNIVFCFPEYNSTELVSKSFKNINIYSIPMTYKCASQTYDLTDKSYGLYEGILTREKPDVIHIFGTEFLYSYGFFKVGEKLGMKERTVVSIQGLVSYYANHFDANLNSLVTRSSTIQEFKNKNNLKNQKNNYKYRGIYEKKLLKSTSHVIGRTRWDYGCAILNNPDINYHFCNETLRSDFYEGSWNYDKCDKNKIFISQSTYPIKSLHTLIEAIKIVKESRPNIKVFVAGENITVGNRVKGNSYGLYLKKLLRKNKLEDTFVFLGNISAKEMKAEMLSSMCFVSPSIIENSPNSVGESMLLGVPCISSNVGGVADMLEDRSEGFIYPYNEFYMLAFYILEVMSMTQTQLEEMSNNAISHAKVTHDPKKNNSDLRNIYDSIVLLNK